MTVGISPTTCKTIRWVGQTRFKTAEALGVKKIILALEAVITDRHAKNIRGLIGLATLSLIFVAFGSSHRAYAIVYGFDIEITGLTGTGSSLASVGDTAVVTVNLNPGASVKSSGRTYARYPLISVHLSLGSFSKTYETGVDFLAAVLIRNNETDPVLHDSYSIEAVECFGCRARTFFSLGLIDRDATVFSNTSLLATVPDLSEFEFGAAKAPFVEDFQFTLEADDEIVGHPQVVGHVVGNVTALATTAESDPTSVPEPTTLAIFAFGLVGLGFMRRRRAA